MDNNETTGVMDYDPADWQTNDNEELGTEQNTEFEGYYDNKSIVKATRELIDVYPELEDDADELVELANAKGVTLKEICKERYSNGVFSDEDETAFRAFKAKNPGITRERYMEIQEAKHKW